MKNGIIKVIRVLCVIVMILDVVGVIAIFAVADEYDSLGLVISNWQANPFNMTPGSDARVINTAILFFIIPFIIFIISGVFKDKKNK